MKTLKFFLLIAALFCALGDSLWAEPATPRANYPCGFAQNLWAEPWNLKQRRVLMVLTNHDQLGTTDKKTGFYLSEASHPYAVFSEAGFVVDFVSPTGESAPIDPKSEDRKDPINVRFLENGEVMNRILDTLAPNEVNLEDYEAVFFAGGHGVMWDLPDNSEISALTAAIYDKGGVVGAVCHGPAGLVNVRLGSGDYLVAGKDVTGFTNAEEDAVELTKVVPFLLEDRLRERGANFSGGENFKTHVKVSERLVTGQNPASATVVAEQIVKLLNP